MAVARLDPELREGDMDVADKHDATVDAGRSLQIVRFLLSCSQRRASVACS